MRKLLIVLIILIAFTGCKKEQQPGTAITTQTLLGRWHVISYTNEYYYQGSFVRNEPVDPPDEDFEYLANGIILQHYLTPGFSSSGQYSVSYKEGKYYYTSGVQGQYGALDSGTGVIEMPDKRTIKIIFERTSPISKTIFTEVLKKM